MLVFKESMVRSLEAGDVVGRPQHNDIVYAVNWRLLADTHIYYIFVQGKS
jgi:hypothetical protein